MNEYPGEFDYRRKVELMDKGMPLEDAQRLAVLEKLESGGPLSATEEKEIRELRDALRNLLESND